MRYNKAVLLDCDKCTLLVSKGLKGQHINREVLKSGGEVVRIGSFVLSLLLYIIRARMDGSISITIR